MVTRLLIIAAVGLAAVGCDGISLDTPAKRLYAQATALGAGEETFKHVMRNTTKQIERELDNDLNEKVEKFESPRQLSKEGTKDAPKDGQSRVESVFRSFPSWLNPENPYAIR